MATKAIRRFPLAPADKVQNMALVWEILDAKYRGPAERTLTLAILYVADSTAVYTAAILEDGTPVKSWTVGEWEAAQLRSTGEVDVLP
jgi:hypothetical protein